MKYVCVLERSTNFMLSSLSHVLSDTLTLRCQLLAMMNVIPAYIVIYASYVLLQNVHILNINYAFALISESN